MKDAQLEGRARATANPAAPADPADLADPETALADVTTQAAVLQQTVVFQRETEIIGNSASGPAAAPEVRPHTDELNPVTSVLSQPIRIETQPVGSSQDQVLNDDLTAGKLICMPTK